MYVLIPSFNKQQTFVCKVFNSFDSKLKNEEALIRKILDLQKQFLLNKLIYLKNMFV